MTAILCKICQHTSLVKSFYCYYCGNQLRCKNCEEELIEPADFCNNCGSATSNHSKPDFPKLNTLKFKESKEERYYEIEFTNDVGKEIKEVVADLLKSRVDNSYIKPFLHAESLPEPASGTFSSCTDQEAEPHDLSGVNTPSIPVSQSDFPHLDDLEMNLNCQENEWLMIFAFYNSDFGTRTFTKTGVWEIYKAKRKTETRFKNLGTNWKSLFKKYISTVKENEFKFTTAGLNKVKTLITDPSQNVRSASATKQKPGNPEIFSSNYRNSPPSRKVVANSIAQEEFDVYRNDTKESLENFFLRKMPGQGNPNRIITIAYYITKINKQDYFTEGHLDFAYRILHLPGKPVHLKQVIINLKNDRIWFQRVKSGGKNGWKLTRQGEIYVEEKLPNI